MSNWSSLNSLDSNIRTVCLKSIVSDAAKTFGTFAAEVVLSWVSQIDPSISSHYDIAGNTSCAESGIGKEANFILLGCLVLVPLNFLIPVVVISEGPVDNWMVILHLTLTVYLGFPPQEGGVCACVWVSMHKMANRIIGVLIMLKIINLLISLWCE